MSLFYINYELTTTVRAKASAQHVERMTKMRGNYNSCRWKSIFIFYEGKKKGNLAAIQVR